MNIQRHVNAYKAAAVTTATPTALLLMLYDGAIKFLNIADKAFDATDPLEYNQTIHNNIVKAQAILRELRSALMPHDGAELTQLASTLLSLYDYFDRRLQEANVRKKREALKEVLTRLSELRSAWGESFSRQNAAKPAGYVSAPAGSTAPSLSVMG